MIFMKTTSSMAGAIPKHSSNQEKNYSDDNAFDGYLLRKEETLFHASRYYDVWTHTSAKSKGIGDFAISYFSPGAVKDLNCKSTKKIIKCRHLAYWWLKQDKPNYEQIRSLKKLEKCPSILNDEALDKEFYLNGCSSDAVYFNLSNFPKALERILARLNQGKEKKYFLMSTNHAMGLCIKKRAKDIVLKFYDPNDTLRHKRIAARSAEELCCLKTKDLLNSIRNLKSYFPDSEQVGCLLSLDKKQDRDECNVSCLANTSEALIYLLLSFGHYGHSKAVINHNKNHCLTARSKQGIPGFFMALQDGHSQAVEAFMNRVLSSRLSKREKEKLLAAKDCYGTPAFFMALENEHVKAVVAFMTHVLSSDLSDQQKIILLMGKKTNGIPRVLARLYNRHQGLLNTYLDKLLASSIAYSLEKELVRHYAPPDLKTKLKKYIKSRKRKLDQPSPSRKPQRDLTKRKMAVLHNDQDKDETGGKRLCQKTLKPAAGKPTATDTIKPPSKDKALF